MSESSYELHLALARGKLGITAEQQAMYGLPEAITRGLGRTSMIGHDSTGIITAEGILVQEQMRINQQANALKQDATNFEGKGE